jgi:glutamate formiminotransferase
MDWNKEVVECVINVSTGRTKIAIDKITEIFEDQSKVKLLHKDIGISADRTVFTIIGEVDPLFEVVRKIYLVCRQHLDIKVYKGNHPTIGIVDVVPFVPIANISESTLINKVEKFASLIAFEFNIPICYYGIMSSYVIQKSLSQIRKGGFQNAQERIDTGQLLVDTGPRQVNSNMGISCWTVRPFMAAYNINLETSDLNVAKRIAAMLRGDRADDNKKLQEVKALAWYISEYNCCQISTNLYDLNQCSMSDIFKMIQTIASSEGIEVLGSELIGMIPYRGIAQACTEHNYLIYIQKLGLNQMKPFIAQERIIELALSLDYRLSIMRHL